jgi:hypothetical protein
MLFDSHFWPLALMFATLSAAFAFFLGITASPNKQRSRHDDDNKKANSTSTSVGMAAAIVTFFVDLIVQRVDLYYAMPSFTGSFFGYFAPVFCALVPAMIIGCIFAGGNGKAVMRCILTVLVLIGWPIAQSLYNSFGPDNAKAYASLPNVHIADAKETIPPTDEQHLVQVTPDMAALKAKTVLSSKGNYSTRYAIGNLTLQAIRGHRYYAAPLVPTNAGDTFWTPLFGGRTESPG